MKITKTLISQILDYERNCMTTAGSYEYRLNTIGHLVIRVAIMLNIDPDEGDMEYMVNTIYQELQTFSEKEISDFMSY